MASILCGDDTGLIKRVNLKDNSSLQRLGFQGAGRSVHRLAWAGAASADGWESAEKEVVVGYKSGAVELYNTQSRELAARFSALTMTDALRSASVAKAIDPATRAPSSVNATSALVGLAVLQPNSVSTIATAASAHERRLLTCSSAGVVHIRPFSTLSLDGSELPEDFDDAPAAAPAAAAPAPAAANGKGKKGKKGASPSLSAAAAPAAPAPAGRVSASGASAFVVGSHICVLKVEPQQQSQFACGGKEHLLKLWDLATASETWREKNVAHDMLNLRQQVWITDLAWVGDSGATQLVTGTAWHQVRSYDIRAQKRALYNVEVGDHAVTCVDVSADGRFIVVGDGGGRLQQLDRRMNARMVHVYRGIGGSVRGIQSHPTLPLLAACGLDRFMRVYDVNTRKQLHKVYLKQKLNAVLFSAQTPAEAQELEEAEAEAAALAAATPADEDGDELWNELAKRAQRIKTEEGAEAPAAGGVGAYVKKRKAITTEMVDIDDEEEAESGVKRAKQSQTPKVKLEPVDDAPAAAAAAPAPASSHTNSFKVVPKAGSVAAAAVARAKALTAAAPKDGQIVFRQAIVYDEDEGSDDEQGEDDDEEGEDDEGEDDEAMEDAEDEEGEDGEEAEDDDEEEGEDADEEEEEEAEQPEPVAVSTPARKARGAKAAPAPTPASTRSMRSRPAR